MGHHAQPREIGDLEQVEVRVDQVAQGHVPLDDRAVQRGAALPASPIARPSPRDPAVFSREQPLGLGPHVRRSPPWKSASFAASAPPATRQCGPPRPSARHRGGSARERSPRPRALEIRARLSSSTRSCDKASISSLFFSPRSRLQITASNCPLRTRWPKQTAGERPSPGPSSTISPGKRACTCDRRSASSISVPDISSITGDDGIFDLARLDAEVRGQLGRQADRILSRGKAARPRRPPGQPGAAAQGIASADGARTSSPRRPDRPERQRSRHILRRRRAEMVTESTPDWARRQFSIRQGPGCCQVLRHLEV